MAKTIQSAAQLREFLANSLLGIRNGDIKIDQAMAITKMAAQVHESLYSEAKVAQVQIALGRAAAVPEVGALKLTE